MLSLSSEGHKRRHSEGNFRSDWSRSVKNNTEGSSTKFSVRELLLERKTVCLQRLLSWQCIPGLSNANWHDCAPDTFRVTLKVPTHDRGWEREAFAAAQV